MSNKQKQFACLFGAMNSFEEESEKKKEGKYKAEEKNGGAHVFERIYLLVMPTSYEVHIYRTSLFSTLKFSFWSLGNVHDMAFAFNT